MRSSPERMVNLNPVGLLHGRRMLRLYDGWQTTC